MKNKVKICGHQYKIVALPDDDTRFGTISFDALELRISTTPPLGIQEETLLHEILHAIYVHASERDWNEHPEHLIQAIANGLWQAGIRPEHFGVELPKDIKRAP